MALIRKNELPMPEMKRIEQKFDDLTDGRGNTAEKGVLPFKESHSFLLKEGGLYPFLGKEKVFGDLLATIPNPKQIFYLYRNADQFVVVGDKMYLCYACTNGVKSVLTNQKLNNVLALQLHGRDANEMLFTSDEGTYVYRYTGALVKVDELPKCQALVGCYGRAFLLHIPTNRVYFSMLGALFGWNSPRDGGYITFKKNEGVISDMVCFNGKIYLYRGDKVSILEVRDESDKFNVENVAADVGNVIRKTSQNVSGKIVFARADGIFTFDGRKVEKVDIRADVERELAGGTDFESGIYNGYYILCYTYDNQKRTFFYDFKTGGSCFWQNGVTSLCTGGEQTYFLFDGDVGGFTASGTGGAWTSIDNDFGSPYRRKILRRVERTGSGTVTLSVYADGKLSATKTLTGDGEVICNVCGRKFSIGISSMDSEASVTGLKMVAESWGNN